MSTDRTSPVDRRHAVRLAFPEPDALPLPENASQPRNSFDWRGPSYQLCFGFMAAPTMDSLLQMVRGGLPGLAEQGLSPQYLIGATAAGAAALRGREVWHAASHMVYLRSDEHLQAWVLWCSKDPLDLLVVAERAEADHISPQANARGGGRMRPRRSSRGRRTGEITIVVEVEAGNEPGPTPSPSLVPSPSPVPSPSTVPSPSPMPSERVPVPLPPETEKRVRRRRKRARA